MDPVIAVEQLGKRYRGVEALRDVTFEVERGEIFGIVGPNGAGKTTTVECIVGLRRPDAGTVRVLGIDPAARGAELRRRVGAQLQAAQLPDRLRVGEAVSLFAVLHPHPTDPGKLLEAWGLSPLVRRAFGDLSGGERQRLFIVLALIGDPEIVVLDEVTTGLDPRARRATWDLVRAIRQGGTTVVLVTHFMDEAELLCDRVGVLHQGRLRALETPTALIGKYAQRIQLRFTCDGDVSVLDGCPDVERVERVGSRMIIEGSGAVAVQVAARLATLPNPPPDLRIEGNTLEQVFLSLTGEEAGQ
jgi:ABC-2 type transport system ATP-binding protein